MSSFQELIKLDGGNIHKIYAAMENDDVAELVRATTIELNKVYRHTHNNPFPKSSETSLKYRIEGNDHYNAGRIRQAIELYNKAIAFAPLGSTELELALGNRSAVFSTIKYYSGCVDDIHFVSEIVANKNRKLADKFKKRLDLAIENIDHEKTVDFVTNVPFTTTFLNCSHEKNSDVPCVCAQVTFTNDKQIKAKTTITPGSLVGIEKAYAISKDEGRYLSCYHCNSLDLCLLPCTGCTQVLFCCTNCMNLCKDEYHGIECYALQFLSESQHVEKYQLTYKTAIKLSLKLGWDAFIIESKNIGLSRMKNSSVKETFNSEIATSILTYDDSEKCLIEGKLFNGSFFCSRFIELLQRIPGYFPTDEIKKAAACDAMARVMLHLSVTYSKVPIKSSGYNFHRKSGPFVTNVHTNYGWFSMSSKLKHSCTPNLQVIGLNDSIGLVALRTIRKGEELTICYYDHFYEHTLTKQIPNERSLQIFMETGHICDCEVCKNNWDCSSAPLYCQMSKKQKKLYKKIDLDDREMSYSSYYDLCNVLDAFPHNSWPHRNGYKHLLDMLKPIQSKYKQNKTYYEDY